MRKRLIESRYQAYGSGIKEPKMTVKAAAAKFGFSQRRADQILKEYKDHGYRLRVEPGCIERRGGKS